MIKLINLHLYKKDVEKMTYTLKLIDFYTDSYEATFGTCELCMSSGVHDEEHFVFETSEGNVINMENGYWYWGDYFTFIEVGNSADFAHWLSQQDFEGEAPQDESELQKEISHIGNKYLSCKEGERYEGLGYSIYNIELSIKMSFLEELLYDESSAIEDDYLNIILGTEGINDEEHGYIISFWRKNKDSKEYNRTIKFHGRDFVAKNIHILFNVVIELSNKSQWYAKSNNGKVDEISILWEYKGDENSLTLEEKDIEKLHHCKNNKDVFDFLHKKIK